MKKKILLLLALSLIFGLVGCSKSTIEEYSNAVKKTAELKKGETIIDATIKNEFDTTKLTEQGKMLLGLFEDISLSINTKKDLDQEKEVSEITIGIAGTSMDFNLYFFGDKSYMEFINPILSDKKYIEFEDEDIIKIDQDKAPSGLSEGTLEKIREKWLEMVNSENIFKGENILISTDAGEVKAREYRIDLNNEQIIELANYTIDTILENKDFERNLEGGSILELLQLKHNLNILKERLKTATDLGFNYKAYIDKDGYIVEEKLGFIYASDKTYGLPIKKSEINISSHMTNTAPEFHIEEPNENNTINIKDIDFEKMLLSR